MFSHVGKWSFSGKSIVTAMLRIVISHYFNFMAESLLRTIPEGPTLLVHLNKPIDIWKAFDSPYPVDTRVVEGRCVHGLMIERILEDPLVLKHQRVAFVDHDAWFSSACWIEYTSRSQEALLRGKKLAARQYSDSGKYFATKPFFAVSTRATWPGGWSQRMVKKTFMDTGQEMAARLERQGLWSQYFEALPEMRGEWCDWGTGWMIHTNKSIPAMLQTTWAIPHYSRLLDNGGAARWPISGIERDRVMRWPLMQWLADRLVWRD